MCGNLPKYLKQLGFQKRSLYLHCSAHGAVVLIEREGKGKAFWKHKEVTKSRIVTEMLKQTADLY